MALVISLTAGAGLAGQTSPDSRVGVLVMAHGGDSTWNAAVEAAVAPLRSRWATEIAFGMADPETMQVALDRLAGVGVGRVAVVRLFVSGESFMGRTVRLLGLPSDHARAPVAAGPAGEAGTSGHGHEPASAEPVEHDMDIMMRDDGLVDDPSMADVLAVRAAVVSVDPPSETLLLLAHGMGDREANDRLLDAITALARRVHGSVPFHDVHVATLQEDWADPRREAEAAIRATVLDEVGAGRTVVVVPLRLHGFGPYADVLDGLAYRADSVGLLPHPIVTEWMERQVEAMIEAAGWTEAIEPSCAVATAPCAEGAAAFRRPGAAGR